MTKKIIFLLIFATIIAFADKAQDVLDKNYEARGGINKLNSIQSIYAEARVFYAGNNEWVSMKYWAKGPKKVKLQQVINAQTVQIAYDGKILWQINPFMGFTKPNIPQAKEAAIMKPQIEKLRALMKGITVQNSVIELKYKGKGDVEGNASEIVNVVTDDYFSYDMYFDQKTYRLNKFVSKTVDNNRGEEIVTEIIFRKYTTIDGILFPQTYDVIINGGLVQKFELIKADINKEIDNSIFAKP
jgi:outer membrane lipoprotein-sorting protein